MYTAAGLRSIFVLLMLSSVVSKVDCNYKDLRKGENADPAGVDDEDISVVMKNGTETIEQEKAIDQKLNKLDRRRPNDTSLEMEVKIQRQQKKLEEKEEIISMNRSTESAHRTKRYISMGKSGYWTKAIIPYIMRDASLTPYLRNEIKKAMKLYEHYTCFRFVEWDSSTQSKYGLDHNNYLNFINKDGCWSGVGNRRLKSGGQDLSCCGGTACIHEIGHSIGFHHTQKSPFAKDILRINRENIKADYYDQYKRGKVNANLRYFPYNLNSIMHYGFWDFNNGNGQTMTVFDPKLKYLVDVSSLAYFYFFKELSIMYKCKEMKCPDFKLKCENTGFVAYIEGKCICRCPTGLDPATGCTKLKSNELDKTQKWPASKFALLRPANTPCPEDSKEGSLTHKSDGGFTNNNYQAMGDHENLHFCTFDHSDSSDDVELWPAGEYCLTKAGGSCPKRGCPFGWAYNKHNQHCYKLTSEKVKGFEKAVELCKKHKAYIVTIEDQNEDEFVKTIINSNTYIGANDIKTENVFVGEDGKQLKYLNWNRGQPDNFNNEDCVNMYTNGKWNDIGCSHLLPVVCEMSLPEFREGSIEYEDDSVTHQGTLPDVISGGKTKLEFCCHDDGNNVVPVVMPTANKFILWQTNRNGCQRVKDTIAVSNHFGYRMKPGKSATIKGTTPLGSIDNNLAYAYFCVYQPVSKDCGKMIQLTDASPTAVVTSPYFPDSYHANMECAWFIESKKNTRIVLSFEIFEIPSVRGKCDDSLEVRLDLPAQPGIKFCGHEFKTSVYSVSNYMNLVLDSKSYLQGKKFKGTVTMIRDEDLCYYGPDKGASYRGKVNFSRNFKACLPWSETTHCVHNSKNANDALSGLDGNFCRNPRSGTDPWCYTQSKGCIRDYCDVCGLGKCQDNYADCADRLKKDPNYCKNTTAWNGIAGCAKTCGQCDRQTKKKYAELSCTNPPIPKDVVLVNPSSSSAQVGKTVDYYYPTNKHSIFALACFSDGSWSKPSDCPHGWILNAATKKCNTVIVQKFPGQYVGSEICRKYLGYMAYIKDEAENDFLSKMVHYAGQSALIGYSDKLKEKSWRWSNGETSTYTNWDKGMPDNWNDEDCVFLSPNGKWNDINCQRYFEAVVCQISLPVSSCEDGTTNCEKFMTFKNVALGKPTQQSSTFIPQFHSGIVVDGITTEGYSHTKTETNPWLEVDLQSVYKIKKILIVNSMVHGHRLHNLKVTIGELQSDMKECTFYEGVGSSRENIELQCSSPIYGRYVKLQLILVRAILQLAEVFVYAYTNVPDITCPKPTLPANAKLVGSSPASYVMGNLARYYFSINENNIFALTCLTSGSWTEISDCPEGWSFNSAAKKCNKIIKKTFTGRYNGDLICRQNSGYVAMIKDQAENDFITNLAANAGKSALIDASDRLKENTWAWSNGEAATYVNWDLNEPNNGNNEDCAALRPTGKWYDLDCHSDFEAVVCQISLPVSSCDDGTTNCEKFMTFKNVALGKPTQQSSTYIPQFHSGLVVDGITTKEYSHTKTEKNPWLEVDLQNVYKIKKLLIVNSLVHGHRLSNLKVTIGELHSDMKECVFYEGRGSSGEYIELQCSSPIYGRYVKLQLMIVSGILQLTEVFVYAYTNVPDVTCQKPTLPANAKQAGSSPTSYVMGTVSRYYFSVNEDNIFSQTCLSTGSWTGIADCPEGWSLNAALKKCNKVIKKTFTGRYNGDLVCRKYSGYVAMIKDQAENDFIRNLAANAGKSALIDASDRLKENTWAWSNGEAATYTNWDLNEPNNGNNEDCAALTPTGKWYDLDCQSDFEAVVCQISLPVSSCEDGTTNCAKFMTLQNVAQGKPAKQSSTWPGYGAEIAVDGKLTGFSHTKNDKSPWWQVDLGKVYPVKRILIVNRKTFAGRLRDLKVTIGKTEDDMKDCVFLEGPGESYEYIELRCSTPLSGQFVRLQMTTSDFLQLTEVYVYTPTPQTK